MAIAAIYNHYVENSVVTFEETPISAQDIQQRIALVQNDDLPWIVAIEGDKLVGYAYATRWKARSAYRYSVESTVYLTPAQQGKGVGTLLYQALISELKVLEINSVIGGITLPNPASVALHEKLGMKQVAHFEKIGYKLGAWQDVGYWQMNLQ